VAGVTGSHPAIEPELRQLAQSILDRLDPAVRLAAARLAASSEAKCEQVWCPICALAAVMTGEQHPLLTIVAEHSVALVAVLRAMVESAGPSMPPDSPTPSPPDPSQPSAPTGEPPSASGRYQHIPVVVED
jgi:hypothetical protein